MESKELAEVALEGARLAAAVHRRRLGTIGVADWDEKGTADFVTGVDREAEERLIEHIRSCCGDHDILAEESTELGDADSIRARFDGAEYLWVLDPLDGTTNYLHRYPMYAASVGVAHRGELVAGAVVDGSSGSEWTAWSGGGAWKDGEAIRASGMDRLDRALIGTGFPFKVLHLLPVYLEQFDTILRRTSGIRRGGAAALDLCHVATGWLDGFWELWLAPWDIAAATVIAREAGALVTTLEGEEDTRAAGAILAGTPAVHAALRELLDAHPLNLENA